MVWNLECRGRTGWSFPALQDASPALPLKVSTQNDGYLVDLDPERNGDLVGRQARCTNPGLTRPGQQSTYGFEKSLEDRVIGREGPDLAGIADENPPVGESRRRKRCRAPELREDTVNLAKSRTGCRRGMGFKRTDDFEELFAAEHAGATELGVGARCNQARHSSDIWSSCQCVATTRVTASAGSTPSRFKYWMATGVFSLSMHESTTIHAPLPTCSTTLSP